MTDTLDGVMLKSGGLCFEASRKMFLLTGCQKRRNLKEQKKKKRRKGSLEKEKSSNHGDLKVSQKVQPFSPGTYGKIFSLLRQLHSYTQTSEVRDKEDERTL